MNPALIESFLYILSPGPLGWSLLGVTLGVLVGCIPGLGGGMLMAMLLPATFFMDHVDAQIFLVSIYVGGVTGGMISAILIGVPGEPSAIMTTIDGGAMARKGMAARALSLGLTASIVGGMISFVVLLFLSLPLARVAMQFQNFDYFGFIMLGLVLIAFIAAKSPVHGMLAGLFGILLSLIGSDKVAAVDRFSFGTDLLSSGISVMPMLLGAFAVRSVFTDMVQPPATTTLQAKAGIGEVLREGGRAFRYPGNLLRSSLLGTWIGILPGLGANIGAMMSYLAASSFSKRKQEFGHGSEEGIVAAEAGNNATVGGALIPMIALGIPGSGQDVILMAALILHAVEPGPLLAIEHPEVFYGVINSYFIANILVFFVMLMSIWALARVIFTPPAILAPLILLFCVVGAVSNANSLADCWIMLASGLAGVAFVWAKIPLPPLVIGFILGPMAEERLRSALMSTDGDFWPLVTRPVALTCLVLALAIMLWPFIAKAIKRHLSPAIVR